MAKGLKEAKQATRRAIAKMKAMQRRYKIVAGVLLTIAVVGFTANLWYPALVNALNSTGSPGGGTTGTFSVAMYDPRNPTVALDPDDFTCTARGHVPGTPTTSSANYEVIAGISNVGDMTYSRYLAAIADYDAIWLTNVTGTIENTEDTYNDAYGDRVYAPRDFQVLDKANNFSTYVDPNADASITIRNLASGAIITTANITAGTNFSVEMYLNNATAGCYDQAYVSYKNYWGHVCDLNLVMSFSNATGGVGCAMNAGDLNCNNLSMTGGDGVSTTLVYHCSYLGQSHVTSTFIWGTTAIADALAVIESPSTAGIVQYFDTTAV